MEDAVLVAFVMRRADAKPWMLENIHRLRVLLKMWVERWARALGPTTSVLFDQTLQLFALNETRAVSVER